MPGDADIASVAALMSEPARAAVLTALADGRALAATTLAAEAKVAPSTASGHLGRLVEGSRHRRVLRASPLLPAGFSRGRRRPRATTYQGMSHLDGARDDRLYTDALDWLAPISGGGPGVG